MKLAIQFGTSTYTSSNEDWEQAITYAVEAELLGVDSACIATNLLDKSKQDGFQKPGGNVRLHVFS